MADFSKKIDRNKNEDDLFAKKIDDFINSRLPLSEVIRVGTTPYCLRIVGAGVIPLMLPQSVLSNSMNVQSKLSGHTKAWHTEPHDITAETMKSLPQALRIPICVIKGNQPQTLVVVTDITDDNHHNIVVPIKLDVQGLKGQINKIESIYGRKNLELFLDKAIESNNLLAINTEKAGKCFPNFSTNIGRQLPKFETLICFDNSIAYSDKNVKTLKEFFSEIKTAAPSAIRAERKVNMANTKMECTGMVMLAEDSKAKAVASVTVNDEFVIKGIKVYDGANGLFASMPSRKIGGEYQDIVFPITKEAREQINNAVLETYGKLAESGLDKLPLEEKAPPEKSASKITVSLHQLDDEKTKAVGQIVIDDSIVVSGVKVRHGTNTQGEEKDFVSMPSYQTQTGEYNEYAHAITKDCRDKINKAVLGAYETLSKTEYKGVKFSELGNKDDISSKYGMNNQFAQKLMGELDKANIPYSARVAETTSLSVKNADRATVDKIQKDLTASLNKQPEQHQSKPKKR